MSGPSVRTGYEPSGPGWSFVDERIVAKAPAGTKVIAGYQDSTVLSIAGWDLWGNVSYSDILNLVHQHGAVAYYMSRWHNPPGFLGTGLDTYRICYVGSP